jgi:hypothetical protein
MSNSKLNKLIYLVNSNFSKIKRSKRPVIDIFTTTSGSAFLTILRLSCTFSLILHVIGKDCRLGNCVQLHQCPTVRRDTSTYTTTVVYCASFIALHRCGCVWKPLQGETKKKQKVMDYIIAQASTTPWPNWNYNKYRITYCQSLFRCVCKHRDH